MADRDPKLNEGRNRPTSDQDFAAWIAQQVAALKGRRFDELDIDDLADEVESLAKRDYRRLVSAIRIILLHMLKWDYQPGHRGQLWRASINEHRDRVWGELASSPSFRSRIAEAIETAYPLARTKASEETGIFLKNFPVTCPYSWDDIMKRPHELGADHVPDDLGDPFQGGVDFD
jgi:hypothetical protein